MTATLSVELASSRDDFSVRQYSVHERLSAPFAVELVAVSGNADVELEELTGQRAVFAIATETSARRYHGVCVFAEQIEVEPRGVSTYVLHIAPQLALLGRRVNYRVFQHKNVREIVAEILDEWGVEHEWRIDAAEHPTLEYRVQYAETDLAFVGRILATEGISYFFEHSADASRLVLNDAPERGEPRADALPHAAGPEERTLGFHVSEVRVSQGLRSGQLRVRDYDARRATRYELAQQAAEGSDLERRLEIYQHRPGAFTTEGHDPSGTPAADDLGVARSDERHGARLARIGLEQERATRQLVSFGSNAIDLHTGSVFSIEGHPRADLRADRHLLVIELALYGAPSDPLHLSGQAVFTAQRYRPPREARTPRIHGLENAIVVGPGGEEIHTDEFGRVRVQFLWDRGGSFNERSSCWIRVSQGWAGGGFGMVALPRVGQEVLVSFLGGDPDQPIVVGRVYNATSVLPHALPENKTVSCWRSRSTPQSAGFNELRFEDKAGSEQVYLHAERDLDEEVGHNHHLRVRAAESIRVGSSQSVSVGGKRTETIGNGDELVVREGDKMIDVLDGDTIVTCENGKIALENGIAFIRMLRDKIELHTGRGASLTLEGDRITLAARVIELNAIDEARVVSARDVFVDGTRQTDIHGGLIKLNC
jgi:type VI secretion system secreted protein VgrG